MAKYALRSFDRITFFGLGAKEHRFDRITWLARSREATQGYSIQVTPHFRETFKFHFQKRGKGSKKGTCQTHVAIEFPNFDISRWMTNTLSPPWWSITHFTKFVYVWKVVLQMFAISSNIQFQNVWGHGHCSLTLMHNAQCTVVVSFSHQFPSILESHKWNPCHFLVNLEVTNVSTMKIPLSKVVLWFDLLGSLERGSRAEL